MDFVKLKIAGISFSQTQIGAYALILEEEHGKRKLPIIIGSTEAQSIAMAMEKEIDSPRPLTHDLFVDFCKKLDARVLSVVIYKFEEGIFYSNIIFEDRDKALYELDSRTSDAVALGLRFDAPIYVYEDIMRRASIEMEIISSSEDVGEFRRKMDEIVGQFSEKEEQEIPLEEMTIVELKAELDRAIEEDDYQRATQIREELNKRKYNE